MTIEFHTPYEKVPEKLISSIRDEIMELSHLSQHISRAEILLREDKTIIKEENKICEISLTIVFGDDLFVHTEAENFKKSAKEAIRDLKRLINQQVKNNKELPDQKTVTVNV